MNKLVPVPAFIKKGYRKESGLRYGLEIAAFVVVFFVNLIIDGLIVGTVYRKFPGLSENAKMITELFVTLLTILLSFAAVRLIEKRGPETMGFAKKNILREYIPGLFLGLAAFCAAVGLGCLAGAVHLNGLSPTINWGFICVIFIGYLIQGMSERNAVMTGGPFGLEGSIFVTVLCIFMIVILFAFKPADTSAL